VVAVVPPLPIIWLVIPVARIASALLLRVLTIEGAVDRPLEPRLTVVILCTSTVLAAAEHVHDGIDEFTQHGRLLAPRPGQTKTPAASKRMSQGLTGREASRSHGRRDVRGLTAMRSAPLSDGAGVTPPDAQMVHDPCPLSSNLVEKDESIWVGRTPAT